MHGAASYAPHALPLRWEIVRQVRELRPDFIRSSTPVVLDLVGSHAGTRVVAQAIKPPAPIINTGIGWHEARIPTIATWCRARPRGVTAKLRPHRGVAAGRDQPHQHAEVAEAVCSRAAMPTLVSMARPLLADPQWRARRDDGCARDQHPSPVTIPVPRPCVREQARACPHPRARHENRTRDSRKNRDVMRRIAVVGAGRRDSPARLPRPNAGIGSRCRRRRQVGGWKSAGQFNPAKPIPAGEEF